VEAVSGGGQLTQPISIYVDHHAPIYLRWYFIVFSGVVLASIVLGFIKIRNSQILKRNVYLEHVVQTRTDEVRNQNEQLKVIANEMAGVNQLKSKMLQMAVHDLRNPLAVLIGYVDILRDEKEIQQQNLVLQSMERVIEKMLTSIESLLSIDEKGLIKPDTKRQRLDLRSLVVDVIADNTLLANRKQQTIDSELEANCVILGDRYQLIEVFENILNNAIKYAPFHSKIGVRLFKKQTHDVNFVRFCVIDNGPGIKDEDRERIFTPYAKSENSPTGGEASSGLGLSIVKEIVQWHNGKIWVENSTEHSGSTFIVELPLAR
jgi:signal transduction histidine kinase